MLFYKATNSNIQTLTDLFQKYAQSSGQFVNPHKSFIYFGSINHRRLVNIATCTGFNIGSLPLTYLGVPIFKGKPKTVHLQPYADKVKIKLSSWKASLLSIAGRVQLVKNVAQSTLLHFISIYSWPIKLIKDVERWMRNFI